jgi:heterotetrameric sarcosine oxidase delta subunit
MLLIDLPLLRKRPEIEFSYGGQAHLARPQRPAALDDQAWADFLYMRSNPKGVHAERWRHLRGCARFFNALRDTTTDHFLATYKSGRRAAAARSGAAVTAVRARRRFASGGRIDRRGRCASPSTASPTPAFAGDTLASALLANGVHLVGRSFKYHRPRGILAAGSEEPNALVTVSRDAGPLHAEPARHAGRAL